MNRLTHPSGTILFHSSASFQPVGSLEAWVPALQPGESFGHRVSFFAAARGHYNLSYHCRSHARAARDGEDAFGDVTNDDDDDDDLGALHWCTNALKFEVR